MEVVKMGKRGDIVIPAEIRKKYGFKPGDLFTIIDVEGIITLCKIKSEGELLTELKHLGVLLEKAGYRKKEDVLKLVEEVKEELCEGSD